jgi:hypothetical protein
VPPANGTYRPIVSTSLAIDYSLGHEYAPFWFHQTTFVLFLVLALLVNGLYRLLLDKTQPSRMRGPAMAETVNYVIQATTSTDAGLLGSSVSLCA